MSWEGLTLLIVELIILVGGTVWMILDCRKWGWGW